MTKSSNLNNISTNNSSALVAPQRSEIRVSFSVEYPALSPNAKSFLRRSVFAVTFLLLATLSSCSLLDVQMPRSYATVLVVLASVGLVYCFHTLWNTFGGWSGIVNHEEKEA